MEGMTPSKKGAFYQAGGTGTQTAKSCDSKCHEEGKGLKWVVGDMRTPGQGLFTLHIAHEAALSLGVTYECGETHGNCSS